MWWLIEIGFVLLLTLGGTATYEHITAATGEQQVQTQLASDTAAVWQQFADAVQSYVQANASSLATGGTVTCSDLQGAGDLTSVFGNGSCSDPLGEKLKGYVSSPNGTPQTYVVLAGNAPTTDALERYGLTQSTIATGSSSSPNTWEAFAMEVAQDISRDDQSSNLGVLVQTATDAEGNPMPHPGAFMIPNSTTGFAGSLAQYFPTSATYPQAVPPVYGYNGYALMAAEVLKGACGLTLSTTPADVVYGSGQAIDALWNASDADSCGLSFNLNGKADGYPDQAASGSMKYTPGALGNLNIEAVCSSANGMACQKTVTVPVGCAVDLDVPESSVEGQAMPISWSAPGTSSCILSYSDGGASQTITNDAGGNGSTTYTPAQAEALSVTALCSKGSVSCSQTRQVNVTCGLGLNVPTSTPAGSPLTTLWNASGTGTAASNPNPCQLSYAYAGNSPYTVGDLPASGSNSYTPRWAEPLTITATCTSSNGPYCRQSANVKVVSPMTLTVPATATVGQSIPISWSAPGTSSCTISFNDGEASIGPVANDQYGDGSVTDTPQWAGDLVVTATCYAPDGTSFTKQATVQVGCDMTQTISGTQEPGSQLHISWNALGTNSCATSWNGSLIGSGGENGSTTYTSGSSGTFNVVTQCTSPLGGSCSKNAEVTVSTPPPPSINYFNVAGSVSVYLEPGSCQTPYSEPSSFSYPISWGVSNAARCSIRFHYKGIRYTPKLGIESFDYYTGPYSVGTSGEMTALYYASTHGYWDYYVISTLTCWNSSGQSQSASRETTATHNDCTSTGSPR